MTDFHFEPTQFTIPAGQEITTLSLALYLLAIVLDLQGISTEDEKSAMEPRD